MGDFSVPRGDNVVLRDFLRECETPDDLGNLIILFGDTDTLGDFVTTEDFDNLFGGSETFDSSGLEGAILLDCSKLFGDLDVLNDFAVLEGLDNFLEDREVLDTLDNLELFGEKGTFGDFARSGECEALDFVDNLEFLGEKETLDFTKPGEFDNLLRDCETLDALDNLELFGDKDTLGDFPSPGEFDLLGDCKVLEALDNSEVVVIISSDFIKAFGDAIDLGEFENLLGDCESTAALDNLGVVILETVLRLIFNDLGDSEAFDPLDNLEDTNSPDDFITLGEHDTLGDSEALDDLIEPLGENDTLGDCGVLGDLGEFMEALGDCEALDNLAEFLGDDAFGDCETLDDDDFVKLFRDTGSFADFDIATLGGSDNLLKEFSPFDEFFNLLVDNESLDNLLNL